MVSLFQAGELSKTGSTTSGCASVEVDGKRVPLSPEGIARAQRDGGEVGKRLGEAVRATVDRAISEA